MNRLLIALVFVGAYAHAGDAVLTWELPTEAEQCTNTTLTSPIASTDIWLKVANVPADTTTHTFTGLEPGDYTYVTSAVDEAGAVSRFSGTASKTVDSLLVDDDKAYTVVQSGGKFVAFIIGTVPVGTVCDASSMVKGEFDFLPFTAYGVPVVDVTITGDTEPVMVVATCG